MISLGWDDWFWGKKTSHVLQLLSTEFDAITFNRRPSCYCRLIVEGFKEIWNKSAKKWLKEEITDLKLRIKENHEHQSHGGDQKKIKNSTSSSLPGEGMKTKEKQDLHRFLQETLPCSFVIYRCLLPTGHESTIWKPVWSKTSMYKHCIILFSK